MVTILQQTLRRLTMAHIKNTANSSIIMMKINIYNLQQIE